MLRREHKLNPCANPETARRYPDKAFGPSYICSFARGELDVVFPFLLWAGESDVHMHVAISFLYHIMFSIFVS
jgi:hypothetical protein